METNIEGFPEKLSGDDAIFHYTGKDILLEHILKERKFKFSNFLSANDPYEYGLKIWGVHGLVPLDERGWNKIQNFFTENAAYLAFCQNSTDKRNFTNLGCSKLRMWAQYGENHMGACLVFSKEKMLNVIEGEYPNGDKRKNFYQDIDYKKDLFETYKNFHLDIGHGQNITKLVYDFVTKERHRIFFTKQIDFRDENEFRFLSISIDKLSSYSGIYFDISDCVIGIILGDRFPDIYRPTVDLLCKDLDIEYGKLVWKYASWIYESWNRN